MSIISNYQALRDGAAVPARQVRDLMVLDLCESLYLVVAVDSDGGIGPRPGDSVKCSAYLAGRFAIRVPLMEIIAAGATPIAALDMLTLPMDGPGMEIIRGVRAELSAAGLSDHFPLSGSTEDNVPTLETGIGTTVLGVVSESDFRPGKSQIGDRIYCVGIPKSGPDDQISLDDPEIIQQRHLRLLLECDQVHEIVPVGSHGILFEAEQIAKVVGLKFDPLATNINITKSAGPSTCAIISCSPGEIDDLVAILDLPVTEIGRLNVG